MAKIIEAPVVSRIVRRPEGALLPVGLDISTQPLEIMVFTLDEVETMPLVSKPHDPENKYPAEVEVVEIN